VGQDLLIHEVSRSHTTVGDSSGRVISSSQRPLPDNTKHSQQTNIHDPGEIRSHSLSSRAAADLRLRPCGKLDRLNTSTIRCFLISYPKFSNCSYQFGPCPTCNREYYRLHCFSLMRPLMSMKLGAERTVLNANECRREFPFNMSYEGLGINRWWWVVGVTASCM